MTTKIQLSYDSRFGPGYSRLTMNSWQHKGSFVIRFSSGTDVAARKICGRVEHVATNQVMRFNSMGELERFLLSVLQDVTREFQQADTLAEDSKAARESSREQE